MNRLLFVLDMLWDRPGFRWALIAGLTTAALALDSLGWFG